MFVDFQRGGDNLSGIIHQPAGSFDWFPTIQFDDLLMVSKYGGSPLQSDQIQHSSGANTIRVADPLTFLQ